MNIGVIGVSHHTADAEIRGKVSFTETLTIEALNAISEMGAQEVLILSTCNRSELYIAGEDRILDQTLDQLTHYFCELFDIDEFADYIYTKKRIEAIRHLFIVASGLDSIVIGEDQILGQLKDAHELSLKLGMSKKILNKVVREAVSTAKRIKTEIKLSEQPLSVSSIGVKFLKEKLDSFEGKTVMIVGAGKMGRLALSYLAEEPVTKIYITNRIHEKLINQKMELPNLEVISYADRYALLGETDILISATSSPHQVIKKEKLGDRTKPLYILDMAMPIDIDPGVKEIEGVQLFEVDDLKEISERNFGKRYALRDKALEMIDLEVESQLQWLSTMKVDPVIEKLKNKCDVISADTLSYLNRKLDLNSKETRLLEKMINSALMRVIREPILNVKATDDMKIQEEYIELIEELFELKGE